jgi:hypothetical protein
MHDQPAPRAAVMVAMLDDIGCSRADQARYQAHAAFAAGAPAVIAGFTIRVYRARSTVIVHRITKFSCAAPAS